MLFSLKQLQYMDCCCPPNSDFDAFVSPLHNTRNNTAKNKFSFRTSPSQSRVTHTSYNHPELSQEIEKLQTQYQLLREQERVINQFEVNRLGPLEEEVKFYEREIIDRSKEIQELNNLLRIKVQERQTQMGQQKGQSMITKPSAKELTVASNNETFNHTLPFSYN